MTQSMTVVAPDISCDHCKNAIETALAVVPGVQHVSVDVPTRLVAITYDDVQASREGLIDVLADEGYPITPAES